MENTTRIELFRCMAMVMFRRRARGNKLSFAVEEPFELCEHFVDRAREETFVGPISEDETRFALKDGRAVSIHWGLFNIFVKQ